MKKSIKKFLSLALSLVVVTSGLIFSSAKDVKADSRSTKDIYLVQVTNASWGHTIAKRSKATAKSKGTTKHQNIYTSPTSGNQEKSYSKNGVKVSLDYSSKDANGQYDRVGIKVIDASKFANFTFYLGYGQSGKNSVCKDCCTQINVIKNSGGAITPDLMYQASKTDGTAQKFQLRNNESMIDDDALPSPVDAGRLYLYSGEGTWVGTSRADTNNYTVANIKTNKKTNTLYWSHNGKESKDWQWISGESTSNYSEKTITATSRTRYYGTNNNNWDDVGTNSTSKQETSSQSFNLISLAKPTIEITGGCGEVGTSYAFDKLPTKFTIGNDSKQLTFAYKIKQANLPAKFAADVSKANALLEDNSAESSDVEAGNWKLYINNGDSSTPIETKYIKKEIVENRILLRAYSKQEMLQNDELPANAYSDFLSQCNNKLAIKLVYSTNNFIDPVIYQMKRRIVAGEDDFEDGIPSFSKITKEINGNYDSETELITNNDKKVYFGLSQIYDTPGHVVEPPKYPCEEFGTIPKSGLFCSWDRNSGFVNPNHANPHAWTIDNAYYIWTNKNNPIIAIETQKSGIMTYEKMGNDIQEYKADGFKDITLWRITANKDSNATGTTGFKVTLKDGTNEIFQFTKYEPSSLIKADNINLLYGEDGKDYGYTQFYGVNWEDYIKGNRNNYRKTYFDIKNADIHVEDENICSMDKETGKITANSTGETNITVSFNNDKSDAYGPIGFKGENNYYWYYVDENGKAYKESSYQYGDFEVSNYGHFERMYTEDFDEAPFFWGIKLPKVKCTFKVRVNCKTDSLEFDEPAEDRNDNYRVTLGKTANFQPIITPNNEWVSEQFSWTSNRSTVASVDKNTGLVRAKGIGEADITATVTDGSTNEDGEPISATYTVTVISEAPSNVKAVSEKNGIRISWNKKDYFDGVSVLRSKTKNGDYEEVSEEKVTGTEFLDETVAYDTTYYYKLVATPKSGEDYNSKPTTPVEITHKVCEPTIKSISVSKNNINVSLSGYLYTGYIFYVGDTNHPSTLLGTSTTKNASLSISSIKQLVKGNTFYIRVKAYASNYDNDKDEDVNYYSKYSEAYKVTLPSSTTTSTTLKGTVTAKATKSKITIKIGKKKLKITKVVGKKIKLKSSNKKVLTISKTGKIKYKKKGKATVTFTYNKKKYKIKFTIKKKGKKKFKVTAKFKKRKFKFTVKRK